MLIVLQALLGAQIHSIFPHIDLLEGNHVPLRYCPSTLVLHVWHGPEVGTFFIHK